MPTPSERKALLFLAAVGTLGAGVRAVRAITTQPAVTAADSAALDRQIDAVDSVRAAGRSRRRAGRGRSGREDRVAAGPGAARAGRRRTPSGLRPAPVDLDAAAAAAIAPVPGIGPGLARRIVADRDSCGPFGSLGALTRVSGIGVALARRIDDYVTFSGTARPPNAIFGACSGGPRPRRSKRPPRP